MFIQEGSASVDWIPERVEADAKLTAGVRVRLSVDAARAGYLYVIDGEQYADGSSSIPASLSSPPYRSVDPIE